MYTIRTVGTGSFTAADISRIGQQVFFLCTPPDRDGVLDRVSTLAYCREGFSVLVWQAMRRKREHLGNFYLYGHTFLDVCQAIDSSGKLGLIKDGRFYFGYVAPKRRPGVIEKNLSMLTTFEFIQQSDIQITPVEEPFTKDWQVNIVSAPEVFATNTWTLSLLTGILRATLTSDVDPRGVEPWVGHGLTWNTVNMLAGYILNEQQHCYKNPRSWRFASSFGVYNLCLLVKNSMSNALEQGVNHVSEEGVADGIPTYYSHKNVIREVTNFTNYLLSNNYNL